jgi:hypothetical protein
MCDFGKIVTTVAGLATGNPYIALAGLGLTAYGTIKSVQAGKEQTKASRQAVSIQQGADDIRQARERRQAIREARIKSAAALQAGANQGAGDSSAVAGGQASLTTQLNSGIGFQGQMGNMSTSATNSIFEANKAGASAGLFGSIANLGANIFSAQGGFAGLQSGNSADPTNKFDLSTQSGMQAYLKATQGL